MLKYFTERDLKPPPDKACPSLPAFSYLELKSQLTPGSQSAWYRALKADCDPGMSCDLDAREEETDRLGEALSVHINLYATQSMYYKPNAVFKHHLSLDITLCFNMFFTMLIPVVILVKCRITVTDVGG